MSFATKEMIMEQEKTETKTTVRHKLDGLVGQTIRAPWSDEQVKALEARQDMEMLHTYTCECGHQLIPSKDGWYCEECTYTQNWCHASDLSMPND
jgi:hypothetical protein